MTKVYDAPAWKVVRLEAMVLSARVISTRVGPSTGGGACVGLPSVAGGAVGSGAASVGCAVGCGGAVGSAAGAGDPQALKVSIPMSSREESRVGCMQILLGGAL